MDFGEFGVVCGQSSPCCAAAWLALGDAADRRWRRRPEPLLGAMGRPMGLAVRWACRLVPNDMVLTEIRVVCDQSSGLIRDRDDSTDRQ
jgi:hypothetical protein